MAAARVTVLPWRSKVLDFSVPTLPIPVWVFARPDSPIRPTAPTGSAQKDLAAVKGLLNGVSLLGKK